MKKGLLLLSTLFFMLKIFSQIDPSSQNSNVLSNTASPNASQFLSYLESPVNHYSGKSNFSIPIYEINVGGLSYPISLFYSHGGIQVNKTASDVGLGWSLSSSFINRTIVGDHDLESISDGYKNKYGFFDFREQGIPLNVYSYNLNVDFYQDIFRFVSPNNNKLFYFRDRMSVAELSSEGVLVNWTIGQKKHFYLKNFENNWINDFYITDYDTFELVTKDGIAHSFQDKEITHSFENSAENYYSEFGNITGSYPRVSSWYISKLKNLNNNEEINFTYESYTSESTHDQFSILFNHPYYRYEAKYPKLSFGSYENNLHFRTDNQGSSYENDYGKYYNRLLQVQRIKKISFRGGCIEFNYEKNREDLYNGKALTGIIVKDSNGKPIKEFELKYDYFYSDLQKNEFSKRLKLLSVQEIGFNKYEFEYHEEQKLPNIGSPLQDFFGYNNGVETVEVPSGINSKYFYYPNRHEYSILPYNIYSDTNHYPLLDQQSIVEGQIDKEPNVLSRIWSLKSVKLPTGGINKFILESNTFHLWGNNLKGGGTRIKQQTIQESTNSQQRTINYIYEKSPNISSGYLFNVPFAGYPTSILFPKNIQNPDLTSFGNNLKDYFFLYNNAKINYDLLNNFFIGYSRVEENEDGLKTIYEFKNEEAPNILTRSHSQNDQVSTFPLHPISEFLISNSAYGNSFYYDGSYRRGKLKKVSFYDKSDNIVMKKENIYKGFFDYYDGSIDDSNFYAPGVSFYKDPFDDHVWELMRFRKIYYLNTDNLVYGKSTQYLPSGIVEDESRLYYDRFQNIRLITHKIGDGITFPHVEVKKYSYPFDLHTQTPIFSELMNINKIDTPVLIENYLGEINPAQFNLLNSDYSTHLISKSKIMFSKNEDTSNLILPIRTMSALGENDFHGNMTYDKFDDKGNILQYTSEAGIPTTTIYGYHQTLPIAKIVGASYEDVMSAMGFITNTTTSYLSLAICIKVKS